MQLTKLSETNLHWMKALQKTVSVVTEPDRIGCRHQHAVRKLTKQEWKRVKKLIRSHELPCTLIAGPYGFWFVVFNHATEADAKPQCALQVEYDQIPGMGRGFDTQDEAAMKLSKFTHTKRNFEILNWYHMRLPYSDPTRYAY